MLILKLSSRVSIDLILTNSYFSVIAAASLPKLEQVIGLEGAFFYSFLGLIAPSLIHIIFLWERGFGKYKWILYKDIALAIFGIFVLVTGCTQSIRQILETS